MKTDDFEQRLIVLLQGAGIGAVADLTDTTIAYWNGASLVYAEVDTQGTGAVTGTFEMDASRWTQWKDWLTDWLSDPVLSLRHDLPHAG